MRLTHEDITADMDADERDAYYEALRDEAADRAYEARREAAWDGEDW